MTEWVRPVPRTSLPFPTRPNKVHLLASWLPDGRWLALCDPTGLFPFLPGLPDDGAPDKCRNCVGVAARQFAAAVVNDTAHERNSA